MVLILNEEQKMLRDSARDFCQAHLPIRQLRELRDSEDALGYSRASWEKMVELGWSGINISEKYGGLGFGNHGLGVVMEELGRSLAASPLLATCWLGASLIEFCGDDAQKESLLPQIVAGELTLALALEERGRHHPTHIETRADIDGNDFIINGKKRFVLDGHSADKIIVVARTQGDIRDKQGISLFLLDPSTSGIKVTRTIMVDSRNCANIEFDHVRLAADTLLGELHQGFPSLELALDRARIGLAAEMLGSLQEAFERTMNYLKVREQFGVQIGTFQALKHRAAQMFCELELAKSAVIEALSALDDENQSAEDIASLASLAKAQTSEAFNLISSEAVQMHGGIGMTDEEEIGFFMKRARVAGQTFGDDNFHQSRYAQLEGY